MSRICRKDHTGSIPKKLTRLPERQAGGLRHRCVGCAYESGRVDERTSLLALLASNRSVSLERLIEEADKLSKEEAPTQHAH